MSLSPCVPENLEDSELKGFTVRKMKPDIKIKGCGTKIDKFILDGKEGEPFIPYDNKTHLAEIFMK